MNRYLILVVWLVFTFSLSISAQETSDQNTEKAKGSMSIEKILKLESGVYGIPFDANCTAVMKWCTDNSMAIENPTEQSVKKDIRRTVNRISNLQKEYDLEKDSLTELEKELLQLAQGYVNAGDVFELAKVAAARDKIEILKNPTFSYEGQKYYLERVHKGMKVDVDGERRTCTDDRITKTAYKLVLTPTVKSERMLRNGMQRMDVFFYGDIGQEPKTYATFASFGNSSERSAGAQFELVFTGMCQKYGTPVFKDWESDFLTGSLRHDVEHLLGTEFTFLFEGSNVQLPPDKAIWARNLLLLGYLLHEGESVAGLKGGDFALFYCDHKTATRIFELHERAVEDFKKQYHDKKEQASTQVHKDF